MNQHNTLFEIISERHSKGKAAQTTKRDRHMVSIYLLSIMASSSLLCAAASMHVDQKRAAHDCTLSFTSAADSMHILPWTLRVEQIVHVGSVLHGSHDCDREKLCR